MMVDGLMVVFWGGMSINQRSPGFRIEIVGRFLKAQLFLNMKREVH